MDLFDAIARRRSIRSFKSTPVTRKDLDTILETINRAPSAGNLQAYEIYLVEDSQKRLALSRAAYDQEFLFQAPVVLVFCTNPARCKRYRDRGAALYTLQDATIAVAYAQLAATALGLSTCWVGAFDEEKVSSALDLPKELRPVAMLPIGEADAVPGPFSRRGVQELVHQA